MDRPHLRMVEPFQEAQPFADVPLDIFAWHIKYQTCARYFVDHAQYSSPVQAVAALVNIRLPFQKGPHPVLSHKPAAQSWAAGQPLLMPLPQQPPAYISLVSYIRRLVVTGFDFPSVLHGFFGDDWLVGIGRIHEMERCNYLFAAKSENWLQVKACYDIGDDQTIPFLHPLQNVSEKELVTADTKWSEWLAMQDWLLGPRAPVKVGSCAWEC